MIQVIEMARYYQKKPSEIVAINDNYLAYCFDEVCYFYISKCMDDKGKINWNKVKWDSEAKKGNNTNKALIDFVKRQG